MIRESEKPTDKDQKGYNELIIFEGINYEYVISANDKMILQLHSKEMKYYVRMTSNLPLDVCMTENL